MQGVGRVAKCMLMCMHGYYTIYRMEGNFGGCKLWRNDKENIIGGINFGGSITKVKLSAY